MNNVGTQYQQTVNQYYGVNQRNREVALKVYKQNFETAKTEWNRREPELKNRIVALSSVVVLDICLVVAAVALAIINPPAGVTGLACSIGMLIYTAIQLSQATSDYQQKIDELDSLDQEIKNLENPRN